MVTYSSGNRNKKTHGVRSLLMCPKKTKKTRPCRSRDRCMHARAAENRPVVSRALRPPPSTHAPTTPRQYSGLKLWFRDRLTIYVHHHPRAPLYLVPITRKPLPSFLPSLPQYECAWRQPANFSHFCQSFTKASAVCVRPVSEIFQREGRDCLLVNALNHPPSPPCLTFETTLDTGGTDETQPNFLPITGLPARGRRGDGGRARCSMLLPIDRPTRLGSFLKRKDRKIDGAAQGHTRVPRVL